jgi:hypothetical protein
MPGDPLPVESVRSARPPATAGDGASRTGEVPRSGRGDPTMALRDGGPDADVARRELRGGRRRGHNRLGRDRAYPLPSCDRCSGMPRRSRFLRAGWRRVLPDLDDVPQQDVDRPQPNLRVIGTEQEPLRVDRAHVHERQRRLPRFRVQARPLARVPARPVLTRLGPAVQVAANGVPADVPRAQHGGAIQSLPCSFGWTTHRSPPLSSFSQRFPT